MNNNKSYKLKTMDIISILAYVIFIAVFAILYIVYRHKFNPIIIPNPIPQQGFVVPVSASFFTTRSTEGISNSLALGHNGLNPLLKLYEDHIDYRFFLKKSKKLDDIEKIDATSSTGTKNLIFYFKNEESVFTANLYSEINFKETLRFFQRKGVHLTDTAKAFME